MSYTKLSLILDQCLGRRSDPILARAELFKPLSLIDLGQIDDEALKTHGTADLMELLLKQSRERTFLKWIKNNPEAMKRLLVRVYGKSGIVYILGVEAKHTSEEVMEAIIAVAPHKKEDIMTAAQQLRQEGEVRGMQQGMQQEKLHIAKNMLSKLHLDVEIVAQATGLSQEELRKLQADLNQ